LVVISEELDSGEIVQGRVDWIRIGRLRDGWLREDLVVERLRIDWLIDKWSREHLVALLVGLGLGQLHRRQLRRGPRRLGVVRRGEVV
jgi:hypothetical protein